MHRLLSLVDVSANGDVTCLTFEYGGRSVQVRLEVVQALGTWVVSDSALRTLFGAELKPCHASLMAALAEEFGEGGGLTSPVSVDMDRLESAVENGSTMRDALAAR